MTDLSYIHLTEDHGQLQRQSGTVSAADLPHAIGMRSAALHVSAHSLSAFRLRRPGRGDALAELGTLQATLLAAVRLLQSFSRLAPLPQAPAEGGPHAFLFSPPQRLRELHGEHAHENMDLWLRNATDETFIEVGDLAPAALREAEYALSAQLSELRGLLRADGEIPAALRTAPRQTPAEAAAARRQQLAALWLAAAQVSAQLGSDAGNASQLATTRRKAGQLLGAWVPSERAYRYPTFQFRPDGQPVWQLAEILQLLREQGGMGSGERRSSGWEEVEWFLSPHVQLDGRPPAELLVADPDRVLRVAQLQFVEDADAGGF
jgi:hypothetical protein